MLNTHLETKLNTLLVTKQLSVYLILFSLVITSAMMYPGFTTLLVAVPINAAMLFFLRWVAHTEGTLPI
jgi:hypothetical protein